MRTRQCQICDFTTTDSQSAMNIFTYRQDNHEKTFQSLFSPRIDKFDKNVFCQHENYKTITHYDFNETKFLLIYIANTINPFQPNYTANYNNPLIPVNNILNCMNLKNF